MIHILRNFLIKCFFCCNKSKTKLKVDKDIENQFEFEFGFESESEPLFSNSSEGEYILV